MATLLAMLLMACGRNDTGPSSKETSAAAAPCPTNVRPNPASDIRIIDFDGARMFVPLAWITGYLDDRRSDGMHSQIASKAITPAIRRNECPGIVHRFHVGERASRHGAISFGTSPLPLPPAQRKAYAGAVVQTFVGARRHEDAGTPEWFDEDVSTRAEKGWVKLRRLRIYKFRGSPGDSANGCTARYDAVDATWLLYRWVTPALGLGLVVQSDAAAPDPVWKSLCAATDRLYHWLTADPAHRPARFEADWAAFATAPADPTG